MINFHCDRWEGFKENRKLKTDGFGMCVNDEKFGMLRGVDTKLIIDQGGEVVKQLV